MKQSIKKQMLCIFIGILSGTILLYWFVNAVFLKQYYELNKQKVIVQAYEQLNEAAKDNSLTSDEFLLEMQKICEKYNISIMVMNNKMQILASIQSDEKMLYEQLVQYFIHGVSSTDVIEETNYYVMQKTFDTTTQTNYLEIWGRLNNGDYFLIRTAVEGIADSAKITNTFLTQVGIVIATVSIFIAIFFTKKITKPILQLVDISEKMMHLDFNAKYPIKNGKKNEIDLLGERMNQLSVNLEKTISELKTANNELMNDIEKKEKTDEMRKEFLSNVSHELKTPIALIQGYAEGLKEGINDDPEGRDFYCDVIMDEANKMNLMVKNLLSLNELEFGNHMISFERFDIAEMIHNYLQSVDLLLHQNEIQYELISDDSVFVWGDEFKTEEVFRNYFSNAMNHAEGEKKITVVVEKLDGKVRISVSNTGKQIPEDCIEYIWDKFYKVDKARTREYGGSGVGLSIVKAIMEAMNESYGVKNEEDGVTFWFELEEVESAD